MKRLMIMAAGTGGHIFPGIAIAQSVGGVPVGASAAEARAAPARASNSVAVSACGSRSVACSAATTSGRPAADGAPGRPPAARPR